MKNKTSFKKQISNKKEPKKLPEFLIKIEKTTHTEITREANPNDEWDGDDQEHFHTFHGFSIREQHGYWDFILDNKPNSNQMYYLVYVLHTTGDSFHHESGCLCMIQFVDNIEDAVYIRNAIRENSKNESFDCLKLTLPHSKKEIEIGVSSWKGYFDRFQSVDIEQLQLI